MTSTVQHGSWAVINESIIKAEDDIEANKHLLLSIADSMDKLCEKLSRLEYELNRKNSSQIL
jgi:hypothetical protein